MCDSRLWGSMANPYWVQGPGQYSQDVYLCPSIPRGVGLKRVIGRLM